VSRIRSKIEFLTIEIEFSAILNNQEKGWRTYCAGTFTYLEEYFERAQKST
jgi:uncharacterized LabA/DUF88 family protein